MVGRGVDGIGWSDFHNLPQVLTAMCVVLRRINQNAEALEGTLNQLPMNQQAPMRSPQTVATVLIAPRAAFVVPPLGGNELRVDVGPEVG